MIYYVVIKCLDVERVHDVHEYICSPHRVAVLKITFKVLPACAEQTQRSDTTAAPARVGDQRRRLVRDAAKRSANAGRVSLQRP